MRTMVISIVLFLCTATATAQTQEETRNLETIERWMEIWNNGEYDLMSETVTSTYIRHEPKGSRVVTRDKYLEEIKSLREKINMRFISLKISADQDRIWVLWTVTTTSPETGEKQFGRGVQIYRLEEGKLAETWWMGTIDQGAWPE